MRKARTFLFLSICDAALTLPHVSDFADGLCCALTSPCLSAAALPPATSPGAPPVVMRHKLDWKKVDRWVRGRKEALLEKGRACFGVKIVGHFHL